jgi:uncharacterized Zn finger protein
LLHWTLTGHTANNRPFAKEKTKDSHSAFLMSWYHSFRPYVSADERRRKAAAAAKKLSKKGHALCPVQLEGRKIASTFWGKSWCDNLEAYSDYENRLPRGRTYVRNGSVLDLQIAAGKIEALVQGSDLYKVTIRISSLCPQRWHDFKECCSGKVTNLLDLLQGRLSKDILAEITSHGNGLFPSPKEIKLSCSCPDWADMCKHVAAVLYGVGARLDGKPELFFTLRGVEMQELITAASATAIAPGESSASSDPALAGADLSEIFGVDIESVAKIGTDLPASPTAQQAPIRARKPRQKKRIVSSKKPATSRARSRKAG